MFDISALAWKFQDSWNIIYLTRVSAAKGPAFRCPTNEHDPFNRRHENDTRSSADLEELEDRPAERGKRCFKLQPNCSIGAKFFFQIYLVALIINRTLRQKSK